MHLRDRAARSFEPVLAIRRKGDHRPVEAILEAVTVAEAIGDDIAELARTEQAQPAHGNSASGGAVGIEIGDDHYPLLCFDGADEKIHPTRYARKAVVAKQALERQVEIRSRRDPSRGEHTPENGVKLVGQAIIRAWRAADDCLPHAQGIGLMPWACGELDRR